MFAGTVPPDFIDDVLKSSLFYQLAASGQHDPFRDTEAWRLEYIRMMIAFGQEASRTEALSIPLEGAGSLWDVIKNSLARQVPHDLLSQTEATFRHLEGEDGTALKLFEQNTIQPLAEPTNTSSSDTSLSIVTTEEDLSPRAVALQLVFVDRAPFLTHAFISFKTSSPVSILPLIKQEQVVGNLELNLITTEFYADAYEDIKETVLEMLDPRRSSLIIELGEQAS
mgnify:CR=1 FL=1